MKKITWEISIAAFTLAFSASAVLVPVDLRCDYAINPLGVDSQGKKRKKIDRTHPH